MNERISILQDQWNGFYNSIKGKRIIKILRGIFLTLILSYLGYKLYYIGWHSVWHYLPTSPLFYGIFMVLYFSLPLTDLFIYRLIWSFDMIRNIPVFIKKRVLNKDVLSYSGEVYFFTWVRKTLNHSDREVAEAVRDVNITSAAASTSVTIILLTFYALKGRINLYDIIGHPDIRYFIIGGFIILLIIPLVLRFRKYIFTMPLSRALIIYSMHFTRLLIGQVLQIFLWAIAMPSISLETWFTYAAVSVLVSRIPFPSNKNLLFLGVGVELATRLQIPEAAMFGLLGTIVALDKLLNFAFFIFITLWDRYAGSQNPAVEFLHVKKADQSET